MTLYAYNMRNLTSRSVRGARDAPQGLAARQLGVDGSHICAAAEASATLYTGSSYNSVSNDGFTCSSLCCISCLLAGEVDCNASAGTGAPVRQ